MKLIKGSPIRWFAIVLGLVLTLVALSGCRPEAPASAEQAEMGASMEQPAADAPNTTDAEAAMETAADEAYPAPAMDHEHASGTPADHSHGEMIEIEAGKTHPTIALEVTPDPMAGWNLHIETTNFSFTPQSASSADVLGEGHAHIYVDGVKLARLYTDWFHIAKLEPGEHEITVSLNGNSHAAYHYDGQPIESSVTVNVPQVEVADQAYPAPAMDHEHEAGTPADHSHGEMIMIEAGKTHPTIALEVTPDPMAGWNLHIETTNFGFTPQNASSADVLGEGHAHIYVDGVKLARLYGDWYHIAKLEPGLHAITVSLNGNSHAAYHYAGQPVEATVNVTVSD